MLKSKANQNQSSQETITRSCCAEARVTIQKLTAYIKKLEARIEELERR